MKPARIAINGFGRVGRALLRALYEDARDQLLPVAINDPAPAQNLAALLRNDSQYGPCRMAVRLDESAANASAAGQGARLSVDEDAVQLLGFSQAAVLPWGELGVDLVFECSGRLHSRLEIEAHCKAGAGRVLLSCPGSGDLDATVVYGVNHLQLGGDEQMVSAASCTSNCLVPVLSVLQESFGIERGSSTTLHAPMNDQPVLDTADAASARLTRAAGRSAVPVPTRLAEGATRILPQLEGRLMSHSLRIPGVSTSAIDLCVQLTKKVSVAEVHESLQAAAGGPLAGVLALSDEPLVSQDLLGDRRSVVVDCAETQVVDGDMLRLLCWFDNEWGFACRLLDVARFWLGRTAFSGR